jgi:hypothetical protein
MRIPLPRLKLNFLLFSSVVHNSVLTIQLGDMTINIFIIIIRALIPFLENLLRALESYQREEDQTGVPESAESTSTVAIRTPVTASSLGFYPLPTQERCRHCNAWARPDADVCTNHLSRQQLDERGLSHKSPKKER